MDITLRVHRKECLKRNVIVNGTVKMHSLLMQKFTVHTTQFSYVKCVLCVSKLLQFNLSVFAIVSSLKRYYCPVDVDGAGKAHNIVFCWELAFEFDNSHIMYLLTSLQSAGQMVHCSGQERKANAMSQQNTFCVLCQHRQQDDTIVSLMKQWQTLENYCRSLLKHTFHN